MTLKAFEAVPFTSSLGRMIYIRPGQVVFSLADLLAPSQMFLKFTTRHSRHHPLHLPVSSGLGVPLPFLLRPRRKRFLPSFLVDFLRNFHRKLSRRRDLVLKSDDSCFIALCVSLFFLSPSVARPTRQNLRAVRGVVQQRLNVQFQCFSYSYLPPATYFSPPPFYNQLLTARPLLSILLILGATVLFF